MLAYPVEGDGSTPMAGGDRSRNYRMGNFKFMHAIKVRPFPKIDLDRKKLFMDGPGSHPGDPCKVCLLYTSDAADE